MTGALPSIIVAFFLGASSLVIVLYRVSPILATKFALSFFFLSIFITVASFVSLVLFLAKSLLAHQPLRSRMFVGSSLRQGIFVATASCTIILLHLLHILNWWIALLVYTVFLLIEMAVGR